MPRSKDRNPKRRRQRDEPRRRKRIVHTFAEDDYVDYKDIALLRKFMSDRGKIRSRRVTVTASIGSFSSNNPWTASKIC